MSLEVAREVGSYAAKVIPDHGKITRWLKLRELNGDVDNLSVPGSI